jgi:hypothetical protein
MSYKVGDKLKIKRSNGTASDAVVKKSRICWFRIVNGAPVIVGPDLDKDQLGKTGMHKGNSYVATELYDVTVLNADGSESNIEKTITPNEIIASYLGQAFGAQVDSSFFNQDEPSAASGKYGGKNMKRTKRTKRTKRSRNKRTKNNNRRR